MNDIQILRVKLDGKLVSDALVENLMSLSVHEKIIVATNNPYSFLSAVRKLWLKKLRRMRIDRARLLTSPEAIELSTRIAVLEKIQFTTRITDNILEANITFATEDCLAQLSNKCWAVYVTYDLPKKTLYLLSASMPLNSLLVIYEQ